MKPFLFLLIITVLSHGMLAANPITFYKTDVSPLFKDQVKKVIAGYSEIKNALVVPDTKVAQKSAEKLIHILSEFDVNQLTPAERVLYEMAVAHIAPAAQGIFATSDLMTQREMFKELSNHIVQLVIANQTSVANEEGEVLSTETIAVERLASQRSKQKQKVIILLGEGGVRICLRYCPTAQGYYVTEGDDKENPYLSKEKK